MAARKTRKKQGQKRCKKKGAGSSNSNGTAANLGFEEKLWQAADKLRAHMDAAEYKHVVLPVGSANSAMDGI